MTFDVKGALPIATYYKWQRWYELFSICRNCRRSTIFVVSQKDVGFKDLFASSETLLAFDRSLNDHASVEGYVSLRDKVVHAPPAHVPLPIQAAFKEAATCLAVQCWNAAGTMFRMCVDLATRSMLPSDDEGRPNAKTCRDLGLRLPWLFDHGYLPADLRELSTCIREDGNDGAHLGILTKEDAEDLLDFTCTLLERVYTEPERLRLAEERRIARRRERQAH